MPRHDVQEGDGIPKHWMVWGDIKPLSAWAPVGWYFALRLPFYRYGQGWIDDRLCWWQRVLFYTRFMPKGREGMCGKWRLAEWMCDEPR